MPALTACDRGKEGGRRSTAARATRDLSGWRQQQRIARRGAAVGAQGRWSWGIGDGVQSHQSRSLIGG